MTHECSRKLRISYPGDQYQKQMLAQYAAGTLTFDENSPSFPVWVSLMNLEGKVQVRKMCKIIDDTYSLTREARKRYMYNGIVIHVDETENEISFKTTLGTDVMELCRGTILTNVPYTRVDSSTDTTTDKENMSAYERLAAHGAALKEVTCESKVPEPENNATMLPDSTTN